MSALSIPAIRAKVEKLNSIPSMPAILVPVLRHLEAPTEDVDVHKVVDLISHDKSLTAQTLHMANSPLFGQWKRIENLRSAVMTLGLSRMREIATSCCMLNLIPRNRSKLNPVVFWEHSLGVALVSRRLAFKIGYPDVDKAYLAGLLHDIGLITNVLLIPEEFDRVIEHACETKLPIHQVERELLGMTHALTGDLLAEHWALGPHLKEVIRRHHDIGNAMNHRSLVAIVNLADLVCRANGLGIGYDESLEIDFGREEAWEVLASEFRRLERLDFARFTAELDAYLREVRSLVGVLFRLS